MPVNRAENSESCIPSGLINYCVLGGRIFFMTYLKAAMVKFRERSQGCKVKSLLVLLSAIGCLCVQLLCGQTVATGRSSTFKPFVWANKIPADCPFPKEKKIKTIEFTGRFANYTNADTWYPSWAANDTLYSPWTDGYILRTDVYEPFRDEHPGYACNSLDFMGRKAATAQAAIAGKDPLNLSVINLPPRQEASPAPYGGRYPCASLVYKGIWYYGTYCLTDQENKCGGVGWTELGPFVGFRISGDYGKTWTKSPHTPTSSLFKEDPKKGKIKIGTPHFVDFGKDMEHSIDGYAYLVAHGSTDSLSCNNWIQGDNIYLIRVKPSPETINDASAYEFYSGIFNGRPTWSKEFSKIRPLLQWKGRLGCVTATYHPYLKKFIMCISRGIENSADANRYDLQILTAESLTGEWRIAAYLESFGPAGYFVNIPSKFISKKTFWLCYSANWNDKKAEGIPKGSHYSLSLHEMRWK